MSFLPQKFSRTQKHPGTHFPTHHISPLITQNRQIPIGLYPVFISIPDDGLRSRTNDILFFQFCCRIDNNSSSVRVIFQAIMRHNSTFFCKPLDMIGFLREKRFGNQQREISIDMPCLFKHIVQLTLDLLPDRISVRLDHHTSSHYGLFGQTGFYH